MIHLRVYQININQVFITPRLGKLPALEIDGNFYSGYRDISSALKETGITKIDPETSSDIATLSNREFLLQLNQNLLIENFNNEDIFRHFTEPALLNAKSRYFWNFCKSRIFPLNYQVQSDNSKNTLIHISVTNNCKAFFIIFLRKSLK